MEDGEGRVIDFKNTLILLTTNAGTEISPAFAPIRNRCPSRKPSPGALREPLLKIFPPALLGRLVTIPLLPAQRRHAQGHFAPATGADQKRVEATHKVPFEFDEGVIELIVSRCTEIRERRLDRRDPHQHAVAGHEPRVPHPHARRQAVGRGT